MAGAEGVRIRLLIHEAEGAPNFYMRQLVIAPGGCTPLHTHQWEHEVFILAGNGIVVSPEGENPISPGDCVLVAPGEQHQFRNIGTEELKFLCLVPR
jgi:quercetin dioxygenase-like cupin family protein